MLMRSDDLTEPERRVWEAFPRGGCVDLRTADPALDDPGGGDRWGSGRTVRAEVIRAVLLGGPDPERGAVAAMRVVGARIAGCLDLVHAEVSTPVYLQQCWFEDSPDLRGASVRHLDLGWSRLPGLTADDLRVDGSLVLTGCHLGGRPATAARPDGAGCALSAAGACVTGDVALNDSFTAEGEVGLLAARIGGSLNLSGATLTNPGRTALDASRLSVDGPVFCRDGFAVSGQVVLRRAHITAFLDLAGARLSNPGGCALLAPLLSVDADLYCTGTEFTGGVYLTDGHISGSLDLSRAKLDNAGHTALDASRLTVDGPVFCRDGFAVSGQVVLRRAHITAFLDLAGARLSNPGGYALFAPGLAVDAFVSFRDGTVFDGQVSLDDAHIGGDLDLAGARLTGVGEETLSCAYLTARGLAMPRAPLVGTADLSHADVKVLTAYLDSTPGGVRVSDLTYETLAPLLPGGQRVRWLTTIREGYLPQPYEQLAASYRRLGHDADARTVLLAKQRVRNRTMPAALRVWGLLQDVTTGYGYRPGRAALWLVGLITAGTIIFGLHHPHPVSSSGNAEFNPFFYTLDLLLPVVSYGQQSAFSPAGAYQWLSYALITAGWIFATTIIAGLTRALSRN
jgi:hypothetical protein